MTTFLGVPITVKGRSVGNLYLTDKAGGGPFTEADQEIVEFFARHAGIAIDNARLHELVTSLAVVEERERIGKDLHDGIIQNLYAVGLSLEDVPDLMDEDPAEVVRRVERAIDNLHIAIGDIRNFIFGLRPDLLGGVSLMAGLAVLVDEFRHNTMIDIELVRRRPGAGAADRRDGAPARDRQRGAQQRRAPCGGVARLGRCIERPRRERASSECATMGAASMPRSARRWVTRDSPTCDPGRTGIGATLEVASEPGSGTTISITLPRARPAMREHRR